MSQDTKPNVIIFIADTLRPDILGTYGGEASTPAFDQLAEQGVRFDRAYAAGSSTPISHAALFTGQYPSDSGYVTEPPEDATTLAGTLQEKGYDTFGIAGRPGSVHSADTTRGPTSTSKPGEISVRVTLLRESSSGPRQRSSTAKNRDTESTYQTNSWTSSTTVGRQSRPRSSTTKSRRTATNAFSLVPTANPSTSRTRSETHSESDCRRHSGPNSRVGTRTTAN